MCFEHTYNILSNNLVVKFTMFHYIYSIYMMYYKQQHHSLTLKHHHCIVLHEP